MRVHALVIRASSVSRSLISESEKGVMAKEYDAAFITQCLSTDRACLGKTLAATRHLPFFCNVAMSSLKWVRKSRFIESHTPRYL